MKTSILLCAGLLLVGCSHEDEPAKPVVNVKVARVEVADVTVSVGGSATIFPRELANLTARVTAPVSTLRARKGDDVAAGQVLASLQNADLVAQRQEAVAVVADVQATLEKITAGTLPGDIQRARGQLQAAEAALKQAETVYARRQQLFKEGAIPSRDLLISQTELAQAQASHDVAKKTLDLLEGQSREKDIRIAESRLEQAKARLAAIEAQVGFTEIRSPFAGTVIEQFVFPGDMAKPDSPLLTVANLSTVVARAQIPEANATSVRTKQECRFTGVDATAATMPGRVVVVNKAVDAARRTVEVWCEIPNPGRQIRAGVFGNVSIVTGVIAKAVVAPVSAVQFAEGTRQGTVMVVDGKRMAHTREVEGGERVGDRVQIARGLSAGELVVTEGAYGLPGGTEVQWTEEAKP